MKINEKRINKNSNFLLVLTLFSFLCISPMISAVAINDGTYLQTSVTNYNVSTVIDSTVDLLTITNYSISIDGPTILSLYNNNDTESAIVNLTNIPLDYSIRDTTSNLILFSASIFNGTSYDITILPEHTVLLVRYETTAVCNDMLSAMKGWIIFVGLLGTVIFLGLIIAILSGIVDVNPENKMIAVGGSIVILILLGVLLVVSLFMIESLCASIPV